MPFRPVGKDKGMYPTLDQVRTLARDGGGRRVPVCEELLCDCYTPIEVMRTLRAASCHCFLLESAKQTRWARYSFLGCNPTLELTCTQGILRVKEGREDASAHKTLTQTDHPKEAIRSLLNSYRSLRVKGMPPFCGGLVGYFSYEYVAYAEPSLRSTDVFASDFCDVDLMLFDEVIAFDHQRQKLMVIKGVYIDNPHELEESYKRAQAAISGIVKLLEGNVKAYFPPLFMDGPLKAWFSLQDYQNMVARAQHYIHEGDLFQVVLSNPLSVTAKGSLFDTYRVLRTTNPSPYMFYFSSDQLEIAGASPETLIKLEEGIVKTYPLAGTCKRGRTQKEDVTNERRLLSDEKELAEHNMLVDLGRNDVGRISELGSVEVQDYLGVQRFSHVMHIGSQVRGRLRADCDALDVVDAILPAGTLSGAPKLRACQIIQELEEGKRGIYGGAVGYLDFTGNMDLCISIRLAYKKDGRVCVQSGAGIVADSQPACEYAECQNKARAVIDALEQAQGGLR